MGSLRAYQTSQVTVVVAGKSAQRANNHIMADQGATLTQHKGSRSSPPVAKEEAERVTPEKAKPPPFKAASLSSNAFGKRFRDKIEIVCTCPALARHVLPMSRDRPMRLVTAYVPAGVVGFEAR